MDHAKTLLFRLLTSLKFWTTILGITSTALAKKGIILDPIYADYIAGFFGVLLLGQGLADHGKERAKIEASVVTTSSASLVTPAGTSTENVETKKIPVVQPNGFALLDCLLGVVIVALALVTAVSMVGCPGVGGAGKRLVGTAIDCAAPAALEATKQYAPAVEQLLQRSTSSEGAVDQTSLEDATKGFLAETGWCVVENVVASALSRLPLPGAPKASPLAADPEELKRTLGAIRASRYQGKTFKPAVGGP